MDGSETLQFATYKVGGKYCWHTDTMSLTTTSLRKLSTIVQLSNPDDFVISSNLKLPLFKYNLFETKFPYRADWLFFLLLIKKGYRPLHLKKKIGGFRLGGQSGGYGASLENFKI